MILSLKPAQTYRPVTFDVKTGGSNASILRQIAKKTSEAAAKQTSTETDEYCNYCESFLMDAYSKDPSDRRVETFNGVCQQLTDKCKTKQTSDSDETTAQNKSESNRSSNKKRITIQRATEIAFEIERDELLFHLIDFLNWLQYMMFKKK